MMMNVSRGVFHAKSIFLTSMKNYKIQTSNLHILCVRRPRSHAGIAAVLSPEVNQIITRFESSEAHMKDVILNLPQEPVLPAVAPLNDNLPDITTVESITSDVPDIVAEAAVALNKLGEPTLQSIGLGSYYTPVGWVQNGLEWVHCTLDLPWWASISICVITMRILLFPVVIKTQKSTIRLQNAMPKMNEIQARLQNAKNYGNDIEAMKIAYELSAFMKENKVSPGSSFGLPLLQAPIFISFFLGLRGMAYAPVESFAHGGLWWFENLIIPDPYFILPSITSFSLFLAIKAGADFQSRPSAHEFARHMPTVFKLVPVALFPFIMYFPSAVCVYWGTTNIVSLIQVLFLRLPKVREYFDIPAKIKHEQNHSPGTKKQGAIKGFKSSWQNMKIAKEIEERDRLDEIRFKKAGRAPPAKTFKENPLLKKEPLVQARKN